MSKWWVADIFSGKLTCNGKADRQQFQLMFSWCNSVVHVYLSTERNNQWQHNPTTTKKCSYAAFLLIFYFESAPPLLTLSFQFHEQSSKTIYINNTPSPILKINKRITGRNFIELFEFNNFSLKGQYSSS